jgi:signal transduction histidine kinase
MAATLRDGHWSGELERHARDGHRILADCRWQLMRDDRGRPTSVFAVESDITEVRAAEEERNRAQRMESLGVLAGGIAHDLNNICTPILLSAQLLAAEETDPQRAELLAAIETGARRGADLIRQVLLFARGEEAERRVLPVSAVLAELRDFCRDAVPKSIEVSWGAPDRALSVTADRTQILQVLVNLITNACDAMPDGGALEIRAEELRDERPEVAFTVEDTGDGMAAEVRGRIFEPFYSTKEPGQGTGLGLATSLAIARRHDGTIDVTSSPGRGSRFTLRLPLTTAVPEPVDEAAPPVPRADCAGRRVLVVDDEAPVRNAVRKVLSTRGYRTVEAADGEEALMLLERENASGDGVEAVVVDLVMPVLGGAETLDRIRARHPRLPVILTSGFDPAGRDGGTLQDPAVRFLRKPFGDVELLGALELLLPTTGSGS